MSSFLPTYGFRYHHRFVLVFCFCFVKSIIIFYEQIVVNVIFFSPIYGCRYYLFHQHMTPDAVIICSRKQNVCCCHSCSEWKLSRSVHLFIQQLLAVEASGLSCVFSDQAFIVRINIVFSWLACALSCMSAFRYSCNIYSRSIWVFYWS